MSLNIGAEECIISILFNNDKLLYKLHVEDLSLTDEKAVKMQALSQFPL